MTGPLILTFRQLVEDHDNLEIFGQEFELKRAREFNIVELARLTLAIEQIQELPPARATRLINRVIFQIMPDLEGSEEFDRLDTEEKLDIIKTFSQNEQAESEKDQDQDQGQNDGGPADWGKIIPRLQKFFGGSPQDWLQLPMLWLNAFSETLPVLKAENILELGQGFFTGQWPTSEDHKKAIEDMIAGLTSLISGAGSGGAGSQEDAESQVALLGIVVRHRQVADLDLILES
jgi:hypothetical protein